MLCLALVEERGCVHHFLRLKGRLPRALRRDSQLLLSI